MVTVHSALTFIVACACFRSAVANGKHTRVYKDGDYVIGGLLPIHNRMMSDVYERSNVCRQLALSHIISVEAMIYIIDKFNERSERLFRRSRRKIRIGYDFRDTCMHVPTAMHQAVGFVNDIEKWAEIADEAKKVCGHPKTNKCYCTFNQTKFKMPEVQGRLVNGRPYCSREDRWEKATMAPPSVSPKSEMTTSAPIYGNYSETNGTTSSRRRYRKQKKTLEPCLNKPIVGLVGPSSSFISAAVAGLFAIYNIPLVSYFSTRVLLSDRKYSSFFRTIPADDNQARAMAEIIERFKWNYVSTIATDLEYSREGIATLQRELKTREICLARDEIYNPRSPEAESQVRKIVAHLKQDDNVKVVVLFMYWQHAEQILAEASRQNLRRITWIACESWASNANVLEMEASVVQGIIGVGLPMYRDNDFLQFLQDRTIRQAINGNPWLRQYVFERLHWRKRSLPVGIHRKCNFTEHGFVANCSEELKLEDLVDKTRVLLAPINAANALMVLLTALIMALNDRQLWHKHELGLLTHRDILPFVAKADFPGFGGITINFRPGGDLQRAEYEILNVQKNAVTGLLEFAMIGNWSLQDDGGSSLKFDESKIQWNSVDNTVPVSICSDYCPPGEEVLPSPSECCWGCRPCAEGHVSNMSMSVECTYCPEHTYPSDNQTWCRPNTDITIGKLCPLNIVILIIVIIGYLSLLIILVTIGIFRNLPTIKSIQLKFTFVYLTAFGYCYPLLYLLPPDGPICRVIPFLFQFTFTVHPVMLLAQTFQVKRFVARRLLRHFCNARGAEFFAPILFTHALSAVGAALHLASTYVDKSGIKLYDIPKTTLTLRFCDDPFHLFELIAFSYSMSVVMLASYFTEKSTQTIGDVTSSQLPYVNASCYIYLLITATVTPIYFIVETVNTRIVILTLTLAITQLTLTGIKFCPKFYIVVMRKLGRAPAAHSSGAFPTLEASVENHRKHYSAESRDSTPQTPRRRLKFEREPPATPPSSGSPIIHPQSTSTTLQRPLDRNRLSVRDKYDQETELQLMDSTLKELDSE